MALASAAAIADDATNATMEATTDSLDLASIQIHPRSEWGARPPITEKMTEFGKHDISAIVVHHFEDPNTNYLHIREVQNYHMHGRANSGKKLFFDIGYHFVIAKDAAKHWAIYEGRSLKYRGAHAPGFGNEHGIAVAFAGNYLRDEIPEEAKQLFLKLATHLMHAQDRELDIVAHAAGKWYAVRDSNCPGAGGVHLVEEARAYFHQAH